MNALIQVSQALALPIDLVTAGLIFCTAFIAGTVFFHCLRVLGGNLLAETNTDCWGEEQNTDFGEYEALLNEDWVTNSLAPKSEKGE